MKSSNHLSGAPCAAAPRCYRTALGGVLLAAAAALAACQQGPETCSTGQASFADEGFDMQPGGACISCHAKEGEGPTFTLAGTVMAEAHDDTQCVGVGGATVEITDADGQILTLQANEVGNFTYAGPVALPYSAKVLLGGKERVMTAEQVNGDCNSCHTADGANGAPGRVRAP